MVTSFAKAVRRFLPGVNEERLNQAYDFVKVLYRNTSSCVCSSDSGEIFSHCTSFRHAVDLAEAILPFYPHEDLLIAALLHEVPCMSLDNMDNAGRLFGKEVLFMLEGLKKFHDLEVDVTTMDHESLRKFFLAVAKDIRVLLLRMVDRLVILQRVPFNEAERYQRYALEVINIYAAVAARLGIYRLKILLEDQAFRIMNPKQYQELHAQVIAELKKRGGTFTLFQEQLKNDLQKKLDIDINITGRIKSVYSIYNKLKKKDRNSINDIYDLFALRVIVPDRYKDRAEDVGYCYQALSYIHAVYKPVMNRFKDYIVMPKWNGYRGLHTTVHGLSGKLYGYPVEIQIRTASMHREAEYGIAAHWWYSHDDADYANYAFSRKHVESFLAKYKQWRKVNQSALSNPDVSQSIKILREGRVGLDDRVIGHQYDTLLKYGINHEDFDGYLYFERQQQKSDFDSFNGEIEWLERLSFVQGNMPQPTGCKVFSVDIFHDRIFVMNPYGDIRELPVGATVVDFAYALDMNLGHRCQLARVNEKVVSLDYKLQNGDQVEIIPKPLPSPNQYWLSFVITSFARDKIKAWFSDLDREKKILAGREMMNRYLTQEGKPALDPQYSLLESYAGSYLSLIDRENLLAFLGDGSLSLEQVVSKLGVSQSYLMYNRTHRPQKTRREMDLSKVRVGGESGMPVKLAKCCSPGINDEIVGYVTRGAGVTLHVALCPVLRNNAADRRRLVSVKWGEIETKRTIKLRIYARDRVGLLRDVAAVISDFGFNISDTLLVSHQNDVVIRDFILEVPIEQDLDSFMKKVREVADMQNLEFVNS